MIIHGYRSKDIRKRVRMSHKIEYYLIINRKTFKQWKQCDERSTEKRMEESEGKSNGKKDELKIKHFSWRYLYLPCFALMISLIW